MQKEKIIIELEKDMIQPEKISDLDGIFRKLEAELWKPYASPAEWKVIRWSEKMTSYEIMLLEQAVLVFQNVILRHIKANLGRTKADRKRTDGED